MNSEPRVLILDSGFSISSIIKDVRESLSDSIVIDVRSTDALKNEADLRLLLHYAEEDGKRITIVTRDPVLASLAGQLGMEVLSELPAQVGRIADAGSSLSDLADGVDMAEDHASTLDQSTVAVYEQSSGTRATRFAGLFSKSTRIAVFLAFFALAATVALAYLRSSLVEVRIVPATTQVNETLIVGVDTDGKTHQELEETFGVAIPSQRLSTDVECSMEIPTTGETREGIVPSVGEVLLINSGLTPVRVPARTKLRTVDGIEFETVNDVEVDGKTVITRAGVKIGETSGTALVAATAVVPGSSGNVPAQSIVSIEPPFDGLLQVVNENEFRGGRDRITRVVSEDDMAQLQKLSRQRMLEEGTKKLGQTAGLDMYLLMPTLELRVLSASYYPDVGKESDRVSVQASGLVEADAVRLADLSKAIGDRLSTLLGDGYSLIADSLAINSLSSHRLGSGRIAISIDVSAWFKAEVNPRLVAEVLAGKDFDEARSRLVDLEKIADLTVDEDIQEFPRWPWLIRVAVEEPSVELTN